MYLDPLLKPLSEMQTHKLLKLPVPLKTYQELLLLIKADIKRDYPGLTILQVLEMDTPTES